jgi:cytochrome c oxidase subunit III
MFFAALFAIYYTLRAQSPELWAERTELLNVPFASVNTTILVLSSVTCQLGVLRAERGQVGRLGGIWKSASGGCASGSSSPTSWARSSSAARCSSTPSCTARA